MSEKTQTPTKYFAAIQSSIRNLQSNTDLCDIFFQVDGENFNQHRGALFNLMGSYLSARLCSGSKMMGSGASPDDRIVLKQFPGGKKVFKEVMRFCYLAENFAVDESNFVGLYYAAGYFNMDSEGNLLALVESWWDNPPTKEKDAEKWFDLCQGALDFETENGLPQDISAKCFRAALSKGSFDPPQMAQALAKKNQSFLNFLFQQQDMARLLSDSKTGMPEYNYQARRAAADLFAQISLQLADHWTEGGNVQDMTFMDDAVERATETQPSCQKAFQEGEHDDHSEHGIPQKVHLTKSIYLDKLDYAWISPNLVYEILKQFKSEESDGRAVETEEIKLINTMFVGLNTSISVPHGSGVLRQQGGLYPYAALKMAQQWLHFARDSQVKDFSREDSLASLAFNTMESVIIMLMRTLSAVIEEDSNSRLANMKMDYLELKGFNPLQKVALNFNELLLERLDLHLQSGYQPTLAELDCIVDPGFNAKNIQPYLATLLKSSASPISYSNDRGPDSCCSRVDDIISQLEEVASWANQEGDNAPSAHETVQALVKVGYGIDELLVGGVCDQTTPEVVELLLQEGADLDFRIYKELAEVFLAFDYVEEVVGSTALHLLFQLGYVKEENLVRLTSIMVKAGANVNAVNSRGNTPMQEFDIYLRNEGPLRIPDGINSIKALLCAPDERVRKRKSRK